MAVTELKIVMSEADKLRSFVFLITLFFCLSNALLVAAQETATQTSALSNPIDISADKLSVNHKDKTAVFEGNVTALFAGLRITCVRMQLVYNDNGEAVSIQIEGNITVISDDTKATAGRATLDSKRGVLVLIGKPTLIRGPHKLEGSRIEVFINSGRVEVTEAKGTFRLRPGAIP